MKKRVMAMISIEEAQRVILENLPARRKEEVHFQAALGRVLADDLRAGMDIPPFDRAAMDGYALRATDAAGAPVELELTGVLRAGSDVFSSIGPGQAMAIMTGAAVPTGADAVQMLEHARLSEDGERVAILKAPEPWENVVRRGREAPAGKVVLEPGRVIGPAEIAVLATFGRTRVSVWRRPGVAVLATGDELIEVEGTPRGGQIRNSNAYSLIAQLRFLGIEPQYLGIAPDEPSELRRRVAAAMENDILIVSGGASAGKYDFVKTILQELGIRILFSRVAIRPGKPTVFARKGDALVFGLPGNPVSSFVSFETFVRPAIGRLCGFASPDLARVAGALSSAITQPPGRTSYMPATASWVGDGWRIEPLPWNGSGDIISFARANALLIFPADRDSLAGGERVEALLLPDFLRRSR